jgi:ubiquinone/menaquinone biosynthesis C-methylase UbiE
MLAGMRSTTAHATRPHHVDRSDRTRRLEPVDAAVGTFSDVDAAHGDEMVETLDDIARRPAVQRLKAEAMRLLAPRVGQRLLDVGCGTGEDVRRLATIVGERGVVIGVDPSETMIREARRRAGGRALPVAFRLGDATALDLPDASVDGVRCERVFQHLYAPETAMAEIARVTKPGGRVVVVDTDWGMHAVHGADPDLTERILDLWRQYIANARSGRRLPALFAAADVAVDEVVSETYVDTAAEQAAAPPFTFMADAAAAAGVVTMDEAAAWLLQLEAAAERQEFLWAFTMFAVGGHRL